MTLYSDNIAKDINDALKGTGINTGKPVTKIRFDADLVTSNKFDMTINGVAVTQTTFATSHVHTMSLIRANIQSHASVDQAELHNDENGNVREIIITGTEGGTLTLTAMAVTLGASQANVAEDSTNMGGTREIAGLPVIASNESTSTSTLSNANSSASSGTLIAANAARKGLIIYNDSVETVLIKYGSTASTTSFTTAIQPGEEWSMPKPVYTGIIDGIWLAADGAARITELT